MRRLLTAILVLLVAAVTVTAGLGYAFKTYNSPGPLEASKVVVIPRATPDEIGALLEQSGIIANHTAFRLAVEVTNAKGALKSPKQSEAYRFFFGEDLADPSGWREFAETRVAAVRNIYYEIEASKGGENV